MSVEVAAGTPESTPRTVVEFVDTKPGGVCHVTREIRVNGSPVLVAKGGICVEHGDSEPTKVTLELLVDEIHYRSESPLDIRRFYSPGGFVGSSTGPHLHADTEGHGLATVDQT